ncbi:hypothetical protein JB92DRAFT_1476139 [Gautieria morchelliformis]|nr:hypothetical protein JB92DRAFT_1476139 [Gautieria morchelliformis]
MQLFGYGFAAFSLLLAHVRYCVHDSKSYSSVILSKSVWAVPCLTRPLSSLIRVPGCVSLFQRMLTTILLFSRTLALYALVYVACPRHSENTTPSQRMVISHTTPLVCIDSRGG